jgi:hypothetical protein
LSVESGVKVPEVCTTSTKPSPPVTTPPETSRPKTMTVAGSTPSLMIVSPPSPTLRPASWSGVPVFCTMKLLPSMSTTIPPA